MNQMLLFKNEFYIKEPKKQGMTSFATRNVFQNGLSNRIGHFDINVKGVFYFLDLSKGLRNAKRTYLNATDRYSAKIELLEMLNGKARGAS